MKLKTKLSTLLLGITSIFALTAAIVTNPNSGSAKAISVSAVSVPFDFSKGTFSNNVITWNDETLKITQEKGSSSTNPSESYISAPRWYQSHKITFNILSNAKIEYLKITCTSNSYAKALSKSTWTDATCSLDSSTVTVIPNTGVTKFTSIMSAQSRISSLSYEIQEASSTANLVSISADSTQKEVYQNQELDESAIMVTGHYDDGSEKQLYSGWTVECDTSVVATGVTATVTHTKTNLKDTFTVDVIEREMYSLVTDITQLVEGSKIIIAGEIDGEVYAATNYASGNNVPASKATLQDNKIVKTSDIAAMTIGTCSNGYTIQDENNLYLYCASSETKSYLKGQTKIVDNSYWSISYSSGEFSIIAHKSTGTTRNILRLNSASNLFNCYASGQNDVKLYVLNPEPTNASKLETFGRLYLNSSENPLVTSETGVDGTSCRNLYLTAKKALSGAWSCIKTDLQNDTTGLALRYEAWARANGDQTPYDGNEAIVNMLNLRATLTNSQSTESSIALVVVIAVISLSSICCYFALNRKKEQK